MNASASIAPRLPAPDWFALRLLPPPECADAIQAILTSLEGIERYSYAIRGEALRIFDERRLYLEFTDPATNSPCTCTFRFLQVYQPDSYRYCEEALKNRQKLADSVPLEAAAKMTRANLRLLEGASDSVRKLPEIHEAGAELNQTQFAAKLSNEHGQHMEPRVFLKLTYQPEELAEVEKALDWIAEQSLLSGIELKDRASQLLAWAIDANIEHEEEGMRGSITLSGRNGEGLGPEPRT